MNDSYQQLDDLLRNKTYSQLDFSEKAFVEEIGYDAEEYEWLRQSKQTLTKVPILATPKISKALEEALEGYSPINQTWHRLLNRSIPLWQAVAASILIGGACFWYLTTQKETPTTVVEKAIIVYQTDTLIQKVLQVDTIYLPAKPVAQAQEIPPTVVPQATPIVASNPSPSKQNKAHIPDVTQLEDLKKNKSGHSLKEHPDLTLFFTESLR